MSILDPKKKVSSSSPSPLLSSWRQLTCCLHQCPQRCSCPSWCWSYQMGWEAGKLFTTTCQWTHQRLQIGALRWALWGESCMGNARLDSHQRSQAMGGWKAILWLCHQFMWFWQGVRPLYTSGMAKLDKNWMCKSRVQQCPRCTHYV